MPRVGGPGLLAALAARRLGSVPAIVISATQCPEALHAGHFLPKPFDVDALLALAAALTRHSWRLAA